MSSVVYLMLLSTISAYNLTCPHVGHWTARAKARCNNVESYVCLWDEVDEIYAEKCTGPKRAREGFQSLLNLGNFNKQLCYANNYQPFQFTTIGSKECIYQKSACNEEGQVYGDTGSPTQDTRCRCDYTKGYAFVSNKNRCNCNPSAEDCSCYLKLCGIRELLSPDYICTKDINQQQNYTCPVLSTKFDNISKEPIALKYEEEFVYYNIGTAWCVFAGLMLLSVLILLTLVLWRKLDVCLAKYFYKAYIVTDEKSEYSVYEGEIATLGFEISKSGQPVYWFKDGVYLTSNDPNMKNDNSGDMCRLLINCKSCRYAGKYKMKLGNKFSPVSKLNIKALFKSVIEPVTCIEGDEVILKCELAEDVLAIWYKDNKEIKDTNMIKADGMIRSLHILNASLSDKGTYKVAVKNMFHTATIDVEPFISNPLQNLIVMEGLDASFICKAKKSDIIPEWFKNDEKLEEKVTIEYGEPGEYKLTITKVGLDDAGTYRIVVNGYKSEAELKVQELPQAIRNMSEHDRGAFLTAAKTGMAPRYYIRIMIVGKESAGKTCLLKNLLEESIAGVESTDGINIEIERCKINIKTGEWSYQINKNEKVTTWKHDDLDTADCSFWDFAGQKEYYATHQTFMTENAIYVVVVRLQEILDDISTKNEQNFDDIEVYIGFWLDNIHTYVGRQISRQLKSTDELDPPVIVVVTGSDEKKMDNSEMRKHFDDYLKNHQIKSNHIRKIHYLSNTTPEREAFPQLKNYIFDIAKRLQKWGEPLPKCWIILEKQLLEWKTSKTQVVPYNDIANLGRACFEEFRQKNTEANLDIQNQLDSFLLYENEVGNIIYFDTLKDCIILDPAWLVDAFRCLVAHEKFLNFSDYVRCDEMKETGKISNDLVETLFKKVQERKFLQHKDYILGVMEKFDIIVRPSFKCDIKDYYMPCMIRKTTYDEVVERFYNDKSTKTSWFFVEFAFLPPAFFNHVLISYIREYSLCFDGKPALGHGMGILKLDEFGRLNIVVCAVKNTIGIQIWHWMSIDQSIEKGPYIKYRKRLVNLINSLRRRYRLHLSYVLKLKCSEGKHKNPLGRHCIFSAAKAKDYICDEHQTQHLFDDIRKDWFELEEKIGSDKVADM